MITFTYRAIQSDGKIEEGSLDAEGKQDALQLLEGRGWTPLKITEITGAAKAATSAGAMPWNSKRVSFDDLEDFTRSLSSLLAAHVPLSRALTVLYRETSNAVAGAKWKSLHDLVIDGVPLAQAMGRSPDVFPRVYIAMVESGEAGGFLEVVLAQIADFQAREKELRAKVLAAMMYPAVLLMLAVTVLIYLLVFFIPRFQTLFEGFDAALPLLTRVIVLASDLFRHYGFFLVGIIALGFYFGRNFLVTERHRRQWEMILFKIPQVGSLAAKIAAARFCRMLGTLLSAGVPLIQSLDVARKSLGYQMLIDLVADSTDRVKKGKSLASSLANCRLLFPGSTLEMIAVAEESGRLEEELIRLAGVTESALDRQLKTTVALAEPLMLFVIAGFIGLIFIGMVIPIFTIQDYIK